MSLSFGSLEIWQVIIPWTVAYATAAMVVWVKWQRGLLQFFLVAYECIFHAGGLFVAAYEKLCVGCEVFLIPFPHFNTGLMLLLPLELIDEYARQPENVVSYTLFGDKVLDNNTQKPIVYRELFKKLPVKMVMMSEEMMAAMEDVLKSQLDENSEMKINMWATATKFLSRTSNRIIIEEPLCRNHEYMDVTVHYAVNIFSLAVYIRFIPAFLRPQIADPLGKKTTTRDGYIAAKNAIRVIKERMRMLEELEKRGSSPIYRTAIKVAHKDPNAQLDYTPRGRGDSFVRESLRANPIREVGFERTIMSKDGITLFNGLHVLRGATLAVPLKAIQHDAKNYPDGFNPKRALQDRTRPKITTIFPDFLSSGLGRPACSGRWFASNLQKVALGHLIMDYNFERVEERPPGMRKVTLVEPCGRARIILRKRKVG
ncbi:cytochrome P450 [Pseudomassariella vexata]|uniref:Cytochrome P450 n=1 Tax=Pseudomassariella vexata TaxID=1141098 RepID=A0A1Y2DBC7_9PEZI|nr:cytochrome P450 [Pseudomassariella vexata]ORY56569.1 cytochrome P450 [Pseudomassariella vexata]